MYCRPRDPSRVVYRLEDILRARIFAIACGYEDTDDLDTLRDDPGFRLALGELAGSGARLASQRTMCCGENALATCELARILAAMIDIYCDSYPAPPAAITLDFDDTCEFVHGISKPHSGTDMWAALLLPIHVYVTATCRPVAVLLRTGRTRSDKKAAGRIRRLVRHRRRHLPDTHITIRGD